MSVTQSTARVAGARHTALAVSTPRQLIWRILRTGRLHYALLLLSAQGRRVLERKYDAFTTDAGYDTTAAGRWGPIGRLVDALVLRFPVHVALRQRLALVVGALCGEACDRGPADRPVQVLSAPCGLGRDVIITARRLASRPSAPRLAVTALDIDARGDVLPELRARAAAAGVAVSTVQADLFAADTSSLVGDGGFDIVNCIGLTAWVDETDLPALFARLAELTAPGGLLVVDNWRQHRHSGLGALMEMPTRNHPTERFGQLLADAGFAAGTPRLTDNGIVEVWAARRVTG
jgi:SAM-dependent methyltransferase